MEFEVIKRSHVKRNIIIGVLGIFIISAAILNFTRAKYRVTDSVPLINGTINYTPYDFKIMALYQEQDGEYVEVESMPSSGYTINEEESYCTLDNVNRDEETKLYTDDRGQHVIGGLKKGSKCYLFFDKQVLASEAILAGKDIQTRNDFNTTMTNITTGTIYYADTSKGRTYYFAGNPTDNWVRFAGFYWRIVRINEDGSIRLIYNGTGTGTTGTSTQIQTSAFNSSYNNNMYVGYMYQSNQVHGLTTDSTIKIELDEWYEENLQSHADKISTEAGFCGDRQPSTSSSTSNGSGGTGTTLTYYGAYNRLITNKTPSFECTNTADLYTVSSANSGNKALDYPIGLITADEVAYAGGVYGQTNNGYYLYTNQHYWTMSPCYFNSADYAYLFLVSSDGTLGFNGVYNARGVRPVINLKADVTITGVGTVSDPYIVVGA